MAITHRYHTDRAGLALELTMRDALAGVEELAGMSAFCFDSACMEILGIEPPRAATPPSAARSHHSSADILDFPARRCHSG